MALAQPIWTIGGAGGGEWCALEGMGCERGLTVQDTEWFQEDALDWGEATFLGLRLQSGVPGKFLVVGGS